MQNFSGWPRTMLAQLLWVSLSFIAASILVVLLVELLQVVGIVSLSTTTSSLNLVVIALGSATYIFMLAILIGLPRMIRGSRISLARLGVSRLPSWRDIGVTGLAIPIYVVALVLVMSAISSLVPQINLEEAQDIGLSALSPGVEMWLAFLLLVVLGPVVEELVFRGYLYGKLRATKAPLWLVVIVTSLLFGVAHMQWNVAIDTFILSVVMCMTREFTGALWPSILIHMFKNGLAFYYLFIAAPGLGI